MSEAAFEPSSFDNSLAERDPNAFKRATLEHLGSKSSHGAAVWNRLVDAGVVNPDEFTLNPRTWVSHSRARGEISLGTQPMDSATKSRLFFQDTRFSYQDEVAYRLNHEMAHGVYFLEQKTPAARTLVEMTRAARESTDGQRGMTAIGSLAHYQGGYKSIEDTTELMAMYSWNPQYLKEYLGFLGNPAYEATRKKSGLITLNDGEIVQELVGKTVEQALRGK